MRPLRLAALASLVLSLSIAGAACSDDSFERTYDIEAYALDGEFDWNSKRLRATVAVSLTLGEDSPPMIELDSDVAVSAVRLAGAGPLAFRSLEDPGRLVISLDGAGDIEPGEALTLEIDYEASAGDALRAVPPRDGDPLPIRALYTNSEPLGAPAWMPCNNRPSDRARFSVAMRMDPSETMVSNGVLTEDVEEEGGARRIRYETAYSLPTYLMAFAISDFDVKAASEGDVPIAIWHRRGLRGSHDANLAELGRMMDLFEGLLGPYPFERYSLVLLPGFPGGMENAGITFQREVGSTEPALAGDLTLTAHELAHQWFGDLVTVETWDDVWIKEGMATLLEYEAAHDHLDSSGAGTLHGDELYPADGVPIRDRDAPPLRKYTSGPYSRAAWLLTQIRSLAGDDAFFAALRGVLERNRFGSIGTDEFLEAFTPAIGAEAVERARRAVDAKAMPQFRLTTGGDGPVVVTLTDPEGALVAPMDYAWVSKSGEMRTKTLSFVEPEPLAPGPDDIMLVLDPVDRHPDWRAFAFDETTISQIPSQESPVGYDEYYSIDIYNHWVSGLRSPPSEHVAALADLAGPHQLVVLAVASSIDASSPDAFAAFEAKLDSDAAKVFALERACAAASELSETDPNLYNAWLAALEPRLSGAPPPFGLAYISRFFRCSDIARETGVFAGEWAAFDGGLAPGEIEDLRLAYLAKFILPVESDFSTWAAVARLGPTLRARAIATERIARRSNGENPEWHALFADLLRSSEASEVLRWAITGLLRTAPEDGSGDDEIFEILRGVLFNIVPQSVHAQAICAAYTVARYPTFPNGNESEPVWEVDPAWDDLARDLAGAPLAPGNREYVTDPSLCL